MGDTRWERIKVVFSEALEHKQEDRAAFIERACDSDAELRREVESLLAARTQGALRTGGAAAAIGNATTTSAPIVEKPGELIGNYKLLQVIGEGGFGTVFLAEQAAPVRRKVALKIIKLGMDTRAVVARFEAERQALAMMDHPHIARVLDGGATESGRPYFVMEYVKGDAITAFADAHKLGVRERLELFSQVCAAVQHAHTKGIIHRDLKPGNVLVSMTDGKPFAKVIDFGIAKATGASLTDKTLFTEHKQLIGTPEYMSPEQAEGSPDIDTRTDVYALGVLLYELLTGATPFDSKRLRSAAFGEMQRIIKEEEPLKPSVRVTAFTGGRSPKYEPDAQAREASAHTAQASEAPGGTGAAPPARESGSSATRAPRTGASDSLALARQLKGDLDWIVMKALDKDRARRYENASQLAEDVGRHLGGEAVIAAPPSAGYRARKFVRRHRQPVLLCGLFFAFVTAALPVLPWIAQQREAARMAAAEARRLRAAMADIQYTGISDSEENQTVRAKLRAKFVSLVAAKEPFERVLQEIGRQADVPIRVEWSEVGTAGVKPSTPVDLTIASLPANAAISAVLSTVTQSTWDALGSTVREGTVVVSHRSALGRERQVETYDVGPLIPSAESPQGAVQLIKDLILGNVTPDEWMENGGDRGSIAIRDRTLVITHTVDAHRQIAALLRRLSMKPIDVTSLAADGERWPGLGPSPLERETIARLFAARSHGLAEDATLDHAIATLRESAGLAITVNWAALARAGVNRDSAAGGWAEGSPAVACLRSAVRTASMNGAVVFDVLEGTIVVTSASEIGQLMRSDVYAIPPVSAQELSKEICCHVDPDGWATNGGSRGYITELGEKLIVRTTPLNHAEIMRLIARLTQ